MQTYNPRLQLFFRHNPNSRRHPPGSTAFVTLGKILLCSSPATSFSITQDANLSTAQSHTPPTPLFDSFLHTNNYLANLQPTDYSQTFLSAALAVGLLLSLALILHLRRTLAEKQKYHAASQLALSAAQTHADEIKALKSTFLANMSHEIRTPLNGVIGMTSLLLRTPLSNEQKEVTEIIRKSGESLIHIINQILDFSKIESGHIELETHTFELEPLIDDILEHTADLTRTKPVDLINSISPTLPPVLEGDFSRIRQILTNLLSNAAQFTSQGEIELHLSGEAAPAGRLLLKGYVRDTGQSIPQDQLAKIFSPFTATHAKPTRPHDASSSLGLAICQKLCRLMGGDLSLQSLPGQGTTFHFSFLATAVHSRQRASSTLSGKHILIVTPHASLRHNLCALLATASATITHASAPEALTCTSYDLALVDLNQGTADGLELTHKLKHLHPTLPVVLLSSTPKLHATSAADTVVAKPIRNRALLTTLDRLLGRSTTTRPIHPLRPIFTPQPIGRQLSALLVEDNPVNQAVAQRMLANLGLRTDIAANGHDALALFTKQTYQLVIMDVQLPEMDGLETTRRIRLYEANHKLPRTPIIALSAGTQRPEVERALSAGMDHFLAKPIRYEDLERTLHLTLPEIVQARLPEPTTSAKSAQTTPEHLNQLPP